MIIEVDTDKLDAYIRKCENLLKKITFNDLIKAGAIKQSKSKGE